MVTQQLTYTLDDLWKITGNCELSNGALIEKMAPASALHGIVAAHIGRLIGNYVADEQLGYVFAAETGFILSRNPDTVRAPDVAFVQTERMPYPIPTQYVPIVPDLAIEVVPPNDRATEIRVKVDEYLAAGTPLVWVVYPTVKSMDVHTSAGSTNYKANDTVSGGDVLSDFSIAVSGLFPQL